MSGEEIRNRGALTRGCLLALFGCLAGAGTLAGQVATPDVHEEIAAVREMLATEKMRAAMDFVERQQRDPSDVVQEWLGICNAYAPTGDEIYRSRLLYKLFKIYGLQDVHIDKEMNVIGIRRGVGGGPSLVLDAHHDNVALWPKDQPVEAFVADGRVWCPAASDDIVGVVQMLIILKALNAADIHTRGDIWFVGLTGEEVDSRGAHQFSSEHYPHHLDWRRGDAIVQFHGGGGEGVTTGSDPLYSDWQLRIFTPFERDNALLPAGVDIRWLPNAVDVLARVIQRIREEVWDPRTAEVGFRIAGQMTDPPVVFMNMAKIETLPILNAPGSEASLYIDMRSKSEERMKAAQAAIRRITEEECAKMPDVLQPCSYLFQLKGFTGVAEAPAGYDKVENAAARTAVAASNVLYGTPPTIDPTQGCGDCLASYMEGMPMMSLRGSVVDRGPGDFEVGGDQGLHSESRRVTTGHSVTQSATIESVWAAAKHGLLFAVTYVGLAR